MAGSRNTRGRLVAAVAVAVLTLVAASASRADRPSDEEIGETQVFLTPDQALEEIFEGVAGVDTVLAVLTAAERQRLHDAMGTDVPDDSVRVYVPRDRDGTHLGYAVIAEEVGKYRPITFMVGTTPGLEVSNVEVLIYRESRGGEVRRSRFLNQYREKTAEDPIRINRDILNIAGATMSVNALNHGVRRVLLTLQVLAEREAL